MDLELAGKIALVAGAGGAIGVATVETLVAEGAQVVAVSHNAQRHRDLEHVTPVDLDLAPPDAPAELIHHVIEERGRIDVLINNVGPIELRPDGFLGTGDDEFKRALEFNLFVALRASRAVLPAMIAQHDGAIINVASVTSLQPYADAVHYSAAKAALVNVTKSLAHEFGPRGVRVNAVSPAPVAVAGEQPVAQLDSATGRPSTPNEVATLIALLASPRTGNITGVNYVIDGGVVKTT